MAASAAWLRAVGLALGAAALAAAFPSNRLRIPNGLRVPCPSGVAGCTDGNAIDCQPTSVCNGVGHRSCVGGTMPLNKFGMDFDREGGWTTALCKKDSDGDGLTNGEELGDPCCLWQVSDTPSDYMTAFKPTHPGFANTKAEVAAYTRPACPAATPKQKGVPRNQFNPGEVQKSVNITVKNYHVPAVRTTYVDFAVNFPDNSSDAFHVVFATAVVDQVANLHHFQLYACPDLWPPELDGKTINKSMSIKCRRLVGPWAPGGNLIETVPWVGLPVGARFGVRAFVMNVHYTNPALQEGIVDNSGIQFWYTPTLRNYSSRMVPMSQLSMNPQMTVPPMTSRWFMTRTCRLSLWDTKKNQPGELNVMSISYHAHLLGREFYAEIQPAGQSRWTDIGSQPVWYFDDQASKDLLNVGLVLRTNDTVQVTCVMDSTSRSNATAFGQETTDEMCWAWFTGYPDYVEPQCQGPFWTGQLDPQESGLGVARRHPAQQSDNIWDGRSQYSGGDVIRLNNTKASCQDYLKLCPALIKLAASMNTSCSDDLGTYNDILVGQTLVTVCCKAACAGACPNHPKCSPDWAPPPVQSMNGADDGAPTLVRCQAAPSPAKESASLGGRSTASMLTLVLAFGAAMLPPSFSHP